jgi:hypothetical protein
MGRSIGVLSLVSLAWWLSACGSNGSSSGSPCEVVPTPAACDVACSPAPGAPNPCAEGMYCNPDGRCYAQCSVGGTECGEGYTCTYDGRCQPGEQPPPPDGPTCPAVNFTAKPITPSILLLIDRSDSMLENFGGVSRWAAIKSALIDPTNGVVTQLQAKAYFGAMIYYTVREPNPVCPLLTIRPRALNNAGVIGDVLATDPTYSWTPTAKSIEAAVASFATTPPPPGSLPFIVLATDGFPSTCDAPDAAQKPLSVAAAAAAYAAGIRVIPLSVGNDIDNEHLQELANAGAGITAGQPNAPLYRGNSPAGLRSEFDAIIRGVVSCDLTVNGSVTQAQAAEANVLLNNRLLQFGTDWQLLGDRTIRLLGTACAELKSSPAPTVNGTFPCGVVIE